MVLNNFIIETTRLLLIALFIYTGLSKLVGHALFVEQLFKVPLLKTMAVFIALLIPIVEIITAFLLLFKKSTRMGWWLSAWLMTAFTVYIVLMMAFLPKLPCSCGGIVNQLTWKQHLIINILLASACWYSIYKQRYLQKDSMHTRE